LEGKKVITMSKPSKGPAFLQKFGPIIFATITGKLSEEVILKIVQRNLNEGACLRYAV
jgi:hypothetical protein